MIVRKLAESLTVPDLAVHPVWKFENRDELGETCVRAIQQLPVQDLSGMLVGTQVCLANGTRKWALLGNIHVNDPRLNELFLAASIEQEGKWFHLARYFDTGYSTTRGPVGLSQFLGLQVEEIFPITFDLRPYCEGDPTVLAGSIQKEPREQLPRNEIIALAARKKR
jgi:hypothetical protein